MSPYVVVVVPDNRSTTVHDTSPPLPASLHLTHFETNPNDIPIRPAPTYVCFNKDGIDRIEPNYVEGGATMLLPAQE